jgi:RHS repeat-associated protein
VRQASDQSTDTGTWPQAGGITNSHSFSNSRQGNANLPTLSFYRNRVYDQNTGRWLQEDPIGVAGGLNLYQFNGNNPVMFTDRFGLMCNPPGSCVTQYAAAFAAMGGTLGVAAGVLSGGITIPLTTGTGIAVGGAVGALVGAIIELTDGSSAEDATPGPVGGKSASEYDRHVQGVADAQGQLQGLEGQLTKTKGPTAQQPIRERIERLKKEIKGHEKEIRQKWPNGRPE